MKTFYRLYIVHNRVTKGYYSTLKLVKEEYNKQVGPKGGWCHGELNWEKCKLTA